MEVTKEQEEEFKRRFEAGPKISQKDFDEFNRTAPTFTSEQYLAFLKATDDKCDEYG